MSALRTRWTLSRLATLLLVLLISTVEVGRVEGAERAQKATKEAEFLSSATRALEGSGKSTALSVRNKKSHEESKTKGNSISTENEKGSDSLNVKAPLADRQGGNGSVTSQVTTALSQLDLGLGYYKMCPFPFSYLHQCENSSECPGSDCCGMYAFPGPGRWQRSCCVPSSVTTIARVARLCIKSDKRPSVTDWLRLGIQFGVAMYTYTG